MAKTVIIKFETHADNIRIDNLIKYLKRTIGIWDDRWDVKTYGGIQQLRKLPNGKVITTGVDLETGDNIMPEVYKGE